MELNADYLRRRAREERAAADRAGDGKVRDLHLELAARYLQAADQDGSPPGAVPPPNQDHGVLPDGFRIIR